LKQQLLDHLYPSRPDARLAKAKKSYLDVEHYRTKSLRALLLSSDEPNRVFHYSSVETAWGDYYALKILWTRAPQDIVDWLNAICSNPINESHRKRALVVEAFRLICQELVFEQKPEQLDALLKSKVSIVTWVGIHAFKNAINKDSFGIDMLSKLDFIESKSEQRTVLCWLINELNYVESAVKPHLIAKLTQTIEDPLTDKQLQDILQPVRGRLGRLHHITPWILESMLIPMLRLEVIDVAQVARVWLGELTTQWQIALNGESIYFKFDGDGAFTDELAALTTYLEPEDQMQVIYKLWKSFKQIARTIRHPLSAQVNWTSHIRAHEANLWLFALACRIDTLVHSDENQPLSELLKESESLIERLSVSEWDNFSSQELLKYFKDDKDKIKSHYLLPIIRAALNLNQ
jgi:hypothetical protein